MIVGVGLERQEEMAKMMILIEDFVSKRVELFNREMTLRINVVLGYGSGAGVWNCDVV